MKIRTFIHEDDCCRTTLIERKIKERKGGKRKKDRKKERKREGGRKGERRKRERKREREKQLWNKNKTLENLSFMGYAGDKTAIRI